MFAPSKFSAWLRHWSTSGISLSQNILLVMFNRKRDFPLLIFPEFEIWIQSSDYLMSLATSV